MTTSALTKMWSLTKQYPVATILLCTAGSVALSAPEGPDYLIKQADSIKDTIIKTFAGSTNSQENNTLPASIGSTVKPDGLKEIKGISPPSL